MNKNTFNFIVPILISATMLSCGSNAEKNSMEEKKTTDNTSITNNEIYNPGADWTLAWADEFTSSTIDEAKWNFQVLPAGTFNDEWQRYTDSNENAFIENDCLVIRAIHNSDSHGMDQYTSARMNTAHKYNFKYGKIAARLKLPDTGGIWPAFWMLGANIDENGGDTSWPQSGEIDILELYGSKDPSVIEGNAHYANSANKHAMMGAVSYKLKQGRFSDAFHIFELEWDEKKLDWLVDGETFASMPIASEEFSEFHKEFFILLNVAVGGTWAGRPNAKSQFPQQMYVDWVRVYQKSR